MGHFLAQLILAVQSDDVGKWANILLVVVLAALWAVAGLLKARKTQPEDEQEQSGAGRQQKPSLLTKRLRNELLGQRARPRPAAPAPAARYQRLPEPKLAALTSRLKPGLQEIPEPISKPIEELQDYRPSPAEKPGPEFSPAFLPAYDDPEQLRRAILHYEILGKPLSLRSPGEHIIGL